MRPTRLLPVLSGLVLALATLVPAHAAGTGTLSVTVVDEHGAPMPGQIMLLDSVGLGAEQVPAASTATFDLPPGEYGVVSVSPWGGMLCAGVVQCSYVPLAGGATAVDGSVTVTEGATTRVRIRGEEPMSLTGPATVGRTLSIAWSPGMATLVEYFSLAAGGVYSPTVQWLRDGAPVADATEDSYRLDAADAGRTISARVAYPPAAAAQFQMITGQPVTARTTPGLRVAKVATKAYAVVVDPAIRATQQGRVRVEVTAPNQIVTGKVTVTVGSRSQTRQLRNGSARVLLPQLAPGRYPVTARYLGTSVYAPSTAKARSITVG